MESVALKRTAVIAIICFFLSFYLYRNLRQATETPPTEPARANETPATHAKKTAQPLKPGRMSWTLDEAMDAYAQYRGNAYVQYVMLQLARNQKRIPDVVAGFPEMNGLPSGSLERLQLEVMLQGQREGEQHKEKKVSPPRKLVPLAELQGPKVKSQPWQQLLAGKSSKVSLLSRSVPADFYFAEFRGLTKLLDALDAGEKWGAYFFIQAQLDATSTNTRQRIQTQLLLDSSPGQGSFYDTRLEQVALTGSDPFLTRGSDVTMLFHYKSDEFLRGIEQTQDRLKRSRADMSEEKGAFFGIDYTAYTTPQREISAYVATLKPNLHLRSNSLAGLRRVLEAVLGHTANGDPVVRLGDTTEFQYIRTLLPQEAAEEDGLLYFSDPFRRRLLGPQAKLTEARRRTAYNHLSMISHAAQMYRSQYGKAPKTLEDLETNQCTPGKFNAGALTCPFGGKYTLSADGTHGTHPLLKTAHWLTPGCELPLLDASAEEADAYRQFVKDYDRDWRTYFDPLALRMQVSAKQFRVETLILPLRENWIYNTLTQLFGNRPEPLDSLPIPQSNLFSVNFRLNREAFVEPILKTSRVKRAKLAAAVNLITTPMTPLYPNNLPYLLVDDLKNVEPIPGEFESAELRKFGISQEKLETFLDKGIGSQVGLHYCDAQIMFDFNLTKLLGDVFPKAAWRNGNAEGMNDLQNTAELLKLAGVYGGAAYGVSSLFAPVYLAVPVQDAKVVDDFLNHLDPVMAKVAALQNIFGMNTQDTLGNFYFLHSKTDTKVRGFTFRYGAISFRLFWARIGDGLYVTNHPAVLTDLQAAHLHRLNSAGPQSEMVAHALLRMRPEHWKLALPGYQLGWEENNRAACQRNLSLLSAAARAFSITPPVSRFAPSDEDRERLVLEYAAKMYGVECTCPDGGSYSLESDGKTIRCSVHGILIKPTQKSAPSRESTVEQLMRDLKDVHATLTFLPEGLRAVVVIEKK